MIYFERNGNVVRMTVFVDVPFLGTRWFSFDWDCGSEVYAGLLTAEMRKAYLKETQEAYDKGYKDGRSKKAKSGPH